ncbi:uncharacterized protein LOC131170727 [Hevea brasiliensis]|uniref:uncharacterized protein LOC131170727 n=1 Tax=Hevea brasiliensis TaxID=3981 RepID=UPI0025F2BB9E|nr:uncharacterized protein LOC131170727 [Hevea brasiliensis]
MELLSANSGKPCLDHFLSCFIGYSMYEFDFERTVCNHGFFMMAPNRWCPETKTLQRPLRLADGTTSVLASITHPPQKFCLSIHVYGVEYLSSEDKEIICRQVSRMLRLSEILKDFYKKHPEAKKEEFGRLFRSATLFEDAVKCFLLCNCTWKRTLSMAEALCNLQPTLASVLEYQTYKAKTQGRTFIPHAEAVLKGKTKANNKRAKLGLNPSMDGMANFPSSKELAMVDVDYLNQHCNLGHRAKTVIDFAVSVESGKLKLKDFEDPLITVGNIENDNSWRPYVDISKQLRKINGLGPFTCANILMCIGFYHQIPIDTETIRLVRKVHGRENCTRKTIENDVKEIYGKYDPYQCLAYWFDLLNDYESTFGKLSELPSSSYYTVTGSIKWKEKVAENNGE